MIKKNEDVIQDEQIEKVESDLEVSKESKENFLEPPSNIDLNGGSVETGDEVSGSSKEIDHKEKSFSNTMKRKAKTERLMQESSKTNEIETTSQPIVIKQSGGSGLGLLALILSLVAIGGIGFLFVEGKNTIEHKQLEWKNQLDKAGLVVDENQKIVQNNLLKYDELAKQVLELKNLVSEKDTQIYQITKSYNDLLTSRYEWLLSEVEYSLGIVSYQLINGGNIASAIQSLTSIQERLNQFNYPELNILKKAVRDDLMSLKEINSVDIASESIKLDYLISSFDNLTIQSNSIFLKKNSQELSVSVNSDKAVGWYDKVWSGIKKILLSFVQVRKIKNTDAMLLSPDQIFFVQENIKLRLFEAKLALVQRQQDIFRSSLNSVQSVVRQYYDIESKEVVDWLKSVEVLLAIDIKSPDINLIQNSLEKVKKLQGVKIAVHEPKEVNISAPLLDNKKEESSVSNHSVSEAKKDVEEKNAANQSIHQISGKPEAVKDKNHAAKGGN